MPIIARLLAIVLVVLGCLPPIARWRREQKVSSGRTFVVPAARPAANETPFFEAEFVSTDNFTRSIHVGSICEASDGRLCAAWYGGTREGARDVKVFFSVRKPGPNESWSVPRAVATRESARQELQRPIRKVGNAMLFAGAEGQLALVYVTISIGGWSGSSLNLKVSSDGGENWSASRRLTLSPFFNFSDLVKNKPVLLSDGAWAVPIYHEFMATFPEILWLRLPVDGGEATWTKTRVCGGNTVLQPALIALSASEAVVLSRTSARPLRMRAARSTDAGRNWSPQELTALPNPNSGLDAVRLSDGRILLAFNDSVSDRDNLSLAVSEDGGRTWTRRAVVEQEPGKTFSYPYLIQARDGGIHLVYTWKGEQIKHAAFNTAWLDAAGNK